MALTNETASNGTDAVVGTSTRNSTRPSRKNKRETRSTAETAASSSLNTATTDTKARQKARPAATAGTKASSVVRKLQSSRGATIEVLMESTGWQAHSVRGFLSAVVRKKLGLNLISNTGKDGTRRYRIDDIATGAK